MENKLSPKVILDELRGEGIVSSIPDTQVEPPRVASTQERGEPHRSGRVVRQPDRFIGLRESIDKVLEETEMDPYNYNEVIQDMDDTLYQKILNTEIESMYSNQIWSLVDPPDGIKLISCK